MWSTSSHAYAELPGHQFVHVYPVKFICGERTVPEGPVKPANYATAVNVLNLLDADVQFTKKSVVALSQGEARGQISAAMLETLKPGEAVEIDCADIRKMLALAPPDFIKGFVVIETPAPPQAESEESRLHALEVVAIYSSLNR